MNENDLDKKWDISRIVQEAVKTAHYDPAPETRERLTALETRQKMFMETNTKEHQDIFEAITAIEAKLDKALEGKADKAPVEKLLVDVELLKSWYWKMLGIGIVIVFLIYTFKDYILSKI